uniref:Uncharacterized protein n=1 Tax=Oncorhynchus tshawytscha TaxID=74940 RepID=A0AAZ3NNZ8_ONCTS
MAGDSPLHSFSFLPVRSATGERKVESPKAAAPTTAGPGYHLAPGNTLESHRRHYQPETMSSEAETQQPPEPAVDSESPPSPPATASAGDKKVIATKVLGTVKWFNVRNGYGFINRYVAPSWTAIKKNNPKKYLRSVGDGETEAKTDGEPSTEKTPAPAAEQGGAE